MIAGLHANHTNITHELLPHDNDDISLVLKEKSPIFFCPLHCTGEGWYTQSALGTGALLALCKLQARTPEDAKNQGRGALGKVLLLGEQGELQAGTE